MRVIRILDEIGPKRERIAAAIGVFDGVHAGHREIFSRIVREARASEASAVVFTFDPHPRAVLQAPRSPRILTPLPEKLAILEALGVDLTVVLRFDRAFASTPAEVFVERWLLERFRPFRVVVGYDFRLGRGREGNTAMLSEYGSSHGFAVDVVSPFVVDGRPVKSTWIRDEIESGNVSRATVLLRRFHSLAGRVVPGDTRGRAIGFPTANLGWTEEGKLWPADGVYAVFGELEGRRIPGAANLGVRPTFGSGGERRLEVHLFDLDEDLDGRPLAVHFVARLREERAFDSIGALIEQIGRDCREAAEILARADEKFFFTRF
jgi:riboflavin kinase/FMN adenylyltransferase